MSRAQGHGGRLPPPRSRRGHEGVGHESDGGAYLFPEPAPEPGELPDDLFDLLVQALLRLGIHRGCRRPGDLVCVEKVHCDGRV